MVGTLLCVGTQLCAQLEFCLFLVVLTVMFVQRKVMVGTLLYVGIQLVPSKQSPTPFVQKKVGILFAFSSVDCDGVGRNLVLWPVDLLVTCSRTVVFVSRHDVCHTHC